jgi:hypothetical protein
MDRAWAAAERAWAAEDRAAKASNRRRRASRRGSLEDRGPVEDRGPAEDRGSEDSGERPVFVDRSGRRRRLTIAIGSSLTVFIVIALVTLVAGLSGVAPLSVPGFPDLAKPNKATSSEPNPAPGDPRLVVVPGAATAEPTPTGTPDPSASKSPNRHVPTQTPTHPTRTK